MAKKIAAKPTTYRSTDFHSRLEARHAVFYDALRIRWAYEPYTFTFNNGWTYTPDFELDVGGGLLVEVKPIFPTDEYLETMAATVPALSRGRLILAVGGFWKAALPEVYEVDEEGNTYGLDLPGMLSKRTTTIKRALTEASRYRFDI